MEERKLNVVNQEEKKTPSYDDLKNYCNQLLMQRNQLAEKLNQITNVLNKLPWLFKVLEYSKMFNEAFVGECINEIELMLTPPEQPDRDKAKADNVESKD